MKLRSLLNNLFLIIVFGAFAVFRLLPVINQQHLVSTAAHRETVQAMPYSENYQSIRGSTDSNTLVIFQDVQGKTHTAQARFCRRAGANAPPYSHHPRISDYPRP